MPPGICSLSLFLQAWVLTLKPNWDCLSMGNYFPTDQRTQGRREQISAVHICIILACGSVERNVALLFQPHLPSVAVPREVPRST